MTVKETAVFLYDGIEAIDARVEKGFKDLEKQIVELRGLVAGRVRAENDFSRIKGSQCDDSDREHFDYGDHSIGLTGRIILATLAGSAVTILSLAALTAVVKG